MQRFALTEEGARVFAEEASSQVNYFCPECLSCVRLKKGEVKVAHFFHLEEHRTCRWKSRAGVHVAIQEKVAEQLFGSTLECFFPEISRIADVAYHEKKIVFEIQVSPISPLEAKKRTEDYWSIGWHVIWLLHVEQFGSQKALPAETVFQGIPHYWTSLFERGGGKKVLRIWDDASFVYNNRRVWFHPFSRKVFERIVPNIWFPPKTEVMLARSYFEITDAWLDYRKSTWSCSVEGDFVSCGEIRGSAYQKKPVTFFSLRKKIQTLLFLLWLKFVGV